MAGLFWLIPNSVSLELHVLFGVLGIVATTYLVYWGLAKEQKVKSIIGVLLLIFLFSQVIAKIIEIKQGEQSNQAIEAVCDKLDSLETKVKQNSEKLIGIDSLDIKVVHLAASVANIEQMVKKLFDMVIPPKPQPQSEHSKTKDESSRAHYKMRSADSSDVELKAGFKRSHNLELIEKLIKSYSSKIHKLK